ncbi:MAG: hypothetical protein EBY69_03510, partial [Burkholderiaceae bacterium]|nr:hypothetical protein [Burkholderiaceae bacterium]
APKSPTYLMEVDQEMVVPVNKKIRLITTANDHHEPMQPMNLFHNFGGWRWEVQLIDFGAARHILRCNSNAPNSKT